MEVGFGYLFLIHYHIYGGYDLHVTQTSYLLVIVHLENFLIKIMLLLWHGGKKF